MKTVILCGGKGTRMGQSSEQIPKPMMPVGDRPILWHIMKIYASHGFNEFVLCLGYKGDKIKEYFEKNSDPAWKIEFAETGEDAKKSERLQKIKHLIPDENFFLTYGDGVSDVDIKKLLKFHEYMGLSATITTVKLPSTFGIVHVNEDSVIHKFQEKPILDYLINGGFMVVNKSIFDHVQKGELENEVFEHLAQTKQICAYKHKGLWKSMDTLKENIELNEMWASGKAFWKIWKD